VFNRFDSDQNSAPAAQPYKSYVLLTILFLQPGGPKWRDYNRRMNSSLYIARLRAISRHWLLALLTWAVLTPISAGATGIDRFAQFISGTQSARAVFEQKVFDRGGKLTQESRGTLAFSRPGKFRWVYEKPFAQLIVGDGTRVWVHDPDLQQVTVRRVDQVMTSTPAALLAGNNEALRAFQMVDRGVSEGLEWVEAVPKEKEGGFERVRLGFGFSGLDTMELLDSFGQKTVLKLTSFERNPGLDPAIFRFVPPKGTDVIGDTPRPAAK
jgi:outer membrane lipoprotein carrier protein